MPGEDCFDVVLEKQKDKDKFGILFYDGQETWDDVHEKKIGPGPSNLIIKTIVEDGLLWKYNKAQALRTR